MKDMDAVDNSDGRLLKPAEVAEMLGVSRSWLYEATKSGRVPCVRLGGLDGPVRFRPAELAAWIGQPTDRLTRDQVGDAPAEDARPSRTHRQRRAASDVAQLRLIPPVDP